MALILPLVLSLWLATAVGVVALCAIAKQGDAAAPPVAEPRPPRHPRLIRRRRGTHHPHRPLTRRAR